MWTSHHQFLEVVKQSWDSPIAGSPLLAFAAKLKRLKALLIAWNHDHFGDITNKVVEAENRPKEAEIKLEKESSSQAN